MSFTTPYFTLPKFTYFKPTKLEDALSLLRQYKGKAKVMAGGIMLVNLMKERQIFPEYVIDIKGIEELKRISKTENGIKIGSAVTAIELQNSLIVRDNLPVLAKAASYMGDRTLQHTVTIGGNISVGMPSTDGLPALMSMDSLLRIKSQDGERTIPASELVIGLGKTSLKDDEIITEIIVPYSSGLKGTYLKLINASEVAITTVAVSVLLKERKLSVVIGAIAPKPYYFDHKSLQWKWEASLTENLKNASEIIGSNVKPMSDAVASSEYRKEVSKVLAVRALKEVFGGA
ncbi:MAG: xanthine dehydrogenase family protein subunit M [Nitrososphaeria archaeon]